MWIVLVIGSAFFLGLYDVAKKQSLARNDALTVLLVATALSTLFLSPWLFLEPGTPRGHLALVFKAVLVTASWVSGMLALGRLPITLVSTFKASRPVLVLVFSILLYGEQLNLWQWGGTALTLLAIFLLSLTGKDDGIRFTRDRGVFYLLLSVLTGVASALYDKHILQGEMLAPLFVQSWTNLYITLLMAVTYLIWRALRPADIKPLRPDWALLLIAVLITVADALYFFAVHSDGALISVISMVRRCSVVVTFIVGAAFFHEKRMLKKSVVLFVMLVAMVLIFVGSR